MIITPLGALGRMEGGERQSESAGCGCMWVHIYRLWLQNVTGMAVWLGCVHRGRKCMGPVTSACTRNRSWTCHKVSGSFDWAV